LASSCVSPGFTAIEPKSKSSTLFLCEIKMNITGYHDMQDGFHASDLEMYFRNEKNETFRVYTQGDTGIAFTDSIPAGKYYISQVNLSVNDPRYYGSLMQILLQ